MWLMTSDLCLRTLCTAAGVLGEGENSKQWWDHFPCGKRSCWDTFLPGGFFRMILNSFLCSVYDATTSGNQSRMFCEGGQWAVCCQPGPGQVCLQLERRGLAQVANSNRHWSGFRPQEVTSVARLVSATETDRCVGSCLCLASKACLLHCCEASIREQHSDMVQANGEYLLAGRRLYRVFGAQMRSLLFLKVSF